MNRIKQIKIAQKDTVEQAKGHKKEVMFDDAAQVMFFERSPVKLKEPEIEIKSPKKECKCLIM